MDSQRFDNIARALAHGLSRRRILGLSAGAAAGFHALVGRGAIAHGLAQAAECDPACDPGLTCCGDGRGACVDVASDPLNCGDCGIVCADAAACVDATCACHVGFTECAGLCVDLLSDPANCGDCGVTCPDGQPCSGGSCACPEGLTDCGGLCVDTFTDPLNCDGCGIACPDRAACEAGACVCPTGEVLNFDSGACESATVCTPCEEANPDTGDCEPVKCGPGEECDPVTGECEQIEETSSTGEEEPQRLEDDVIPALVERLKRDPDSIARGELMRIGLVDRLSRQSGLPFDVVFDKLQELTLLDLQGQGSMTRVDGETQFSLTVNPGEVAIMHDFVAGPDQSLCGFRFENTSSEELFVAIETGDLLSIKRLPPGDYIEIGDPALVAWVIVLAAAAAAAITTYGLVRPCEITRPAGPTCALVDNSVGCNDCIGSCGAGLSCVGVVKKSCYLLMDEPTVCGCR